MRFAGCELANLVAEDYNAGGDDTGGCTMANGTGPVRMMIMQTMV